VVIAPRSDLRRHYEIVGGARLPVPASSDDPQPVDDRQVDGIPLIPRDGTVLQTGETYWIVQAGYRFSAIVDELTPTQRVAAISVPPDAPASIPVYSPNAFTPPDGTLVSNATGNAGAGSTVLHGPTFLYLGGAWRTTTQACSAASIVTIPASDPPLSPQ
jgi:hypothetical protein